MSKNIYRPRMFLCPQNIPFLSALEVIGSKKKSEWGRVDFISSTYIKNLFLSFPLRSALYNCFSNTIHYS